MSITVLKPGLLTSLQDGGRPGYAALGVGRAGAIDLPAWQLANALVGNTHDEAALEFTLIGPTLRFERAAVIALAGAPVDARADGQRLPTWTQCLLPAGTVLQVGGMPQGCRGYLAVRGGFEVEVVMGSRSTDLHAHIGPNDGRALRAGDMLRVGEHPSGVPSITTIRHLPWGLDPRPWFDFQESPIALMRGHHFDALEPVSQHALLQSHLVVSTDSNRTASRLDGIRLALRAPMELISEATLPGTVQLPPSGQPIVLQVEAPVTGGYPRIGQVAAVDLPRLAQRAPGHAVCFVETSLDAAFDRLMQHRQRLQRLLHALAQRLEHA